MAEAADYLVETGEDMSYMYHVTVAVSDVARSKAFYDPLFDLLGWKVTYEDEESKAYTDGRFDYWIIPAEAKESNRHNDGVGYNHLAIRVDKQEDVDACHELLKKLNAQIDMGPQAFPEYNENYYAIFFFDPDGTRLEVVYT